MLLFHSVILFFINLVQAQVFIPITNWNCANANQITKSSLIFWLDTADSSRLFSDASCITPAITNGSNVACIKEKSLSNFNVTTSSVCTASPTLVTGAQNNLSGINFDGTATKCLEINNAIYSIPGDEYTYFVVTRPNAAMAGYGSPFNNRADSSVGFILYAQANNFYFWHSSNGGWNASAPFVYTNGTTYVMGTSHKRSVARLYEKNGAQSTGTPISTAFSGNPTARVGRSYTAGGGYPYNGHVYEVLLYDRALSDGEKWCVRKYLGTKWGVSVQ